MKPLRPFLLLLPAMLCAVCVLRGQTSEFSHQVILESKSQYNDLDSRSAINPGNVMGIDPFGSITQLYPILGFMHTMDRTAVKLQVEGVLTNHDFRKDSVQFAFQELYVQMAVADRHYVSVGKRRLDWGTGILWNPTNFYIQKDPFRTQNRLEGIYQLRYTYLMDGGSLQAYIFPANRGGDFSFALKYDYTGERIDASLSLLQHQGRQQLGLDVSYGGDRFTAYAEGVVRNFLKSYRVSTTGDLIAPTRRRSRFFAEVAAGASVNLNAHFSLRGEYRFRQDYLNSRQIDRFEAALPMHTMIYDPTGISRHTAFGSVEWKDTYDRYFLQMRLFADPVSGQCVLSPLATWKHHNFQVELSAMIYNNVLALFNVQGSLVLSYHF